MNSTETTQANSTELPDALSLIESELHDACADINTAHRRLDTPNFRGLTPAEVDARIQAVNSALHDARNRIDAVFKIIESN